MGKGKGEGDNPSPIPKVKKKSTLEQSLLSERAKKFDPNATKEDCVNDLRRLQKENEFKYINRGFYRINGKYSDGTWNKHFGTFLEFRRQAGLELTRNQHKLEREIAKHASLDNYRKFFSEEVLPYHNKYKKPESENHIKTFMVCSDLHDVEVDRFCLSVFIDQCKKVQPDYVVFNGDIYDLYEFSRYSIDVREIKIKERFDL